jgi:hypothetical protein
MEDEFVDLSAFQISPEDQARIAAIQRDEAAKRKGAVSRRRRQDDLFVQITHRDAVAGFMALGCPFALVWCALLYREWAEKRGTVRLPTALLRSWGINRWSWGRALARLEKAGLVTVERRPGQAARVTLVRGEPVRPTHG